MDLFDRLKQFFKREVVYHLHYDLPVSERVLKPLDYHVPIEVQFGDRLIKVER